MAFLQGWSRRTKAVLFVLVLLFAEVVALLTVLGFFDSRGPVQYDAFWMTVAFGALIVCDVLAAFMTFYVKVTPSPGKR